MLTAGRRRSSLRSHQSTARTMLARWCPLKYHFNWAGKAHRRWRGDQHDYSDGACRSAAFGDHDVRATALSHQFARAFGNDRFHGAEPNDLMFHVVLHHDAGWAEFDRDPVTDQATGLPYNLVETPAEYIAVTSRGSPEFNQRQHPFCGLMSSMHSWGLYNGRYGLSSMVLIDKIPPHDRPLVQRMLDGEIDRQKRLKAELAQDPKTSAWIADKRLFQNYKQLQFFDTLALYFNRTHSSERGEVKFEHVPLSGEQDTTITVRPRGRGVYELSPNPFAAHSGEYAFAGRPIEPGQHEKNGGWSSVLAKAPTVWERFRLVTA